MSDDDVSEIAEVLLAERVVDPLPPHPLEVLALAATLVAQVVRPSDTVQAHVRQAPRL